MKNIIPHLWYTDNAIEAATFYMSLFEDSRIIRQGVIENTPSGDAPFIYFTLAGQEFGATSGGPFFKINPSVSFMIQCSTKEEVDYFWKAFADGGDVLMKLGSYPFSPYYGWIQDPYGLSWQVFLVENEPITQKIIPCLLFAKDVCDKAEDAARYYASVFPDGSVDFVSYYQEGEASTPLAKVNYLQFTLNGMKFAAMDHGMGGEEAFTPAISFMVNCDDQKEIDHFWEKLSFVEEAEQCGWCADKYGNSWQVIPADFDEIFVSGSKEESERVTAALLEMKKLDIEALEKARRGE
jgi:predicted 3-demethylubiquinone-9 3-methyltransferase (glyoxalase superfamily)